MSDNKTQPKFSVGQFFLQKDKNKLFRIVKAEWQGVITKPSTSKVKEFTTVINDWLYDIEYLALTKPQFGRYYENRIAEECTPVANQDLPKAIYE